jgi:hypothetical protein
MPLTSALDLPIPRNLTAVLQLLQRWVGPGEHRYWCGGTIAIQKLSAFVTKMEDRYPILRNTRGRSYDRQRGRAVVHMIIYPPPYGTNMQDVPHPVYEFRSALARGRAGPRHEGLQSPVSDVFWWLVSSWGTGGLADPNMHDTHVARDAMDADGHITVGDYVLLYAAKKEPRSIRDTHTGGMRQVFKERSTWTWKLRTEVFREVRASIDGCCANLDYGLEPTVDRPGWGLRGVLAAQRVRPLFAGVRNQVVDLHRYAHDVWRARRAAWRAAHSGVDGQSGADAGKLLPIAEVLAEHLPKMVRYPIYDRPSFRVRDLLGGPA